MTTQYNMTNKLRKALVIILLISGGIKMSGQNVENSGRNNKVNLQWVKCNSAGSNINSDLKREMGRIIKPTDADIQSTTNAAANWSKIGGPNGGNVSSIKKYYGKYYAITAYQIHVLENNIWRPLNLKRIGINWIITIHIFSSGRIMAICDNAIYYVDNEGEDWKNALGLHSDPGIGGVVITGDNEILVPAKNGIYKAANDSLNFKLLTLQNYSVNSIAIDDSNNIWAATNNGLYKAKYGEFDWKEAGISECVYGRILFDSSGTVFTYASGRLYKSTNSGNSWSYIGLNSEINDMQFNNRGEVVAVSGYKIYCFNDEGLLWQSKDFVSYLISIYTLSEGEYLVGTLTGGVFKYSSDSDKISFLNEGMKAATIRGLTSLPNGEILTYIGMDSAYVSGDMGNTWKGRFATGSSYVKVSKSGLLYHFNQNVLSVSSDCGFTWSTINNNISYSIVAIDISNDDKLICVSNYNGDVFFSENYGQTFKKIVNGIRKSVEEIKIISAQEILLSRDSLFYIGSGGNSFSAIETDSIKDPREFATSKRNNIFLVSNGRMFRSKNGLNWKRLKESPDRTAFIRMADNGNIFVCNDIGNLYYSTDEGESWVKLVNPIGLFFITGFCVGNNGCFYLGTQGNGLYKSVIPELPRYIPVSIGISENYPNPFSTITTIRYDIPHDSFADLKIYDSLGREIEKPFSEFKPAGRYYYEWKPSNCSSGIYLFRLAIGDEYKVGKMMYIK